TRTRTAMLRVDARPAPAIRLRIITMAAAAGDGVAILGPFWARPAAGEREFGDRATAGSAASADNPKRFQNQDPARAKVLLEPAVGMITRTPMPLSLDDIFSPPLSWRTRSFVPRIPAPSDRFVQL